MRFRLASELDSYPAPTRQHCQVEQTGGEQCEGARLRRPDRARGGVIDLKQVEALAVVAEGDARDRCVGNETDEAGIESRKLSPVLRVTVNGVPPPSAKSPYMKPIALEPAEVNSTSDASTPGARDRLVKNALPAYTREPLPTTIGKSSPLPVTERSPNVTPPGSTVPGRVTASKLKIVEFEIAAL